ncbi:DNA fragmentation factor subunit beta [Diachasmimorpha longicaudata]|uniref:DNA fragmentation factor subunit beta n=1 Tax=Diachasmimorpha longicaudata TaxID=58733 RepID=UPI0030B8BA06
MSLLAHCLARLTQSQTKHELRGYKVTDVNRSRKFGVACRSLRELKRKACAKLNITDDLAEINLFLLDGSLVDEEYFYTLQPQTTMILQKPGEKVRSDADLLYETLRRVNIDYLTVGDQASKFLTENLKRKVAVLYNLLNVDDSKTDCSRREDHPEWFMGLETNVTTKEAYMHRRCQDRIRGYLYKTIEQIKGSEAWSTNRQARLNLHGVIEYFKLQLKEDHYLGYYFDRSRSKEEPNNIDKVDGDEDECYDHCPCRLALHKNHDNDDDKSDEDEIDARRYSTGKTSPAKKLLINEKESCPYTVYPRGRSEQYALCDSRGEFRCEGVWSGNGCGYGDRHRINPYRSREELILFSTWNLDHKIERSRTLVPQLLKHCEEETIPENIVFGLYDNLFTVKNISLVHIVCHDKGSHK